MLFVGVKKPRCLNESSLTCPLQITGNKKEINIWINDVSHLQLGRGKVSVPVPVNERTQSITKDHERG